MPKDLSRPAGLVGTFYTTIHRRMAHLGETPTNLSFRKWLTSSFPSPKSLRVLDVGCGVHGVNARACIKHGFTQVSAVDNNPDAIVAGADIRCTFGSAMSLPFDDHFFDLTVCTGVVHHISDPQKVFNELRRVTKIGGKVYISLYAFRDSPFEYIVRSWRYLGRLFPYRWAHALLGRVAVFNNFIFDHTYVPILLLYSAEEAHGALKSSGLALEADWVEEFDVLHRFRLTGDGLLRVFVCTV